MSETKINNFKLRAEALMHRNVKQKDELMKDLLEYIKSKKYPSAILTEYRLIIFDYNQLHQLHNGKTDEQWKKGKASLIHLISKL